MSRMSAAIAAIAALVLLVHAGRYYPFFADDALISLRYSVRFAHGLGLTWTDGDPVEGYSNPLWVLACTVGIKLGFEPILAARVLGLSCGAGAVVAISRANDGLPGAVSAVVAAMCGPLAVWSMGGLEQPMVALFLAISLAYLLPRLEEGSLWPAGLALAGLVLSRPDSPLFVAIAVPLVWWWRGVRPAATLGGPPAGAWLGWEAFRLVYYHDWIPNPAYAKVSPSWMRFGQGLEWVGTGALWMAPLVVASFLAFRYWRSRRVILLAALALGWHLYVAWIGGDIFPAHRHWVAGVVLHALLVAEGLRGLSPRAITCAAVAIMVPLAVLTVYDKENQRGLEERWEWECATVARALGAGFSAQKPLLGADPAGCMPYFSDLPAVDLFGLNDRWLAHHPPADLGTAWIGHGLGNGRYVLDRKPDLLVFCSPWGGAKGCGRSGKELLAMSAFRDGYRMLTFEGEDPSPVRSKIWTRIDGPLGPRREGSGWVIPGYWLAGDGAVARLDAGGRMVGVVEDKAWVKLPIEGKYRAVAPAPLVATWSDGTLRVDGDGEVREIRLVPLQD
jgi:arabinofuranosyltransferase